MSVPEGSKSFDPECPEPNRIIPTDEDVAQANKHHGSWLYDESAHVQNGIWGPRDLPFTRSLGESDSVERDWIHFREATAKLGKLSAVAGLGSPR